MRTSATGISTNSAAQPARPGGPDIVHRPPATQRGFTLIEILVVLLIIGVMIVGGVLTAGLTRGDSELDEERERVLALTDYLREQAALQNREYGMRCFTGGYEFLVYEPRLGRWLREPGEPLMRARRLPAGLAMTLQVEGRAVVLPPADQKDDELAPQILLYSSGDLNLFELTLRREPQGAGVRFEPAPDTDRIIAVALEPEPA